MVVKHECDFISQLIISYQIFPPTDDVSKRMKAIEWCLMTKGKNDEVPSIDIPDFVPFYKNMNKDNLEKLYVNLQRKKTALQKEETALIISQAAVGNRGT